MPSLDSYKRSADDQTIRRRQNKGRSSIACPLPLYCTFIVQSPRERGERERKTSKIKVRRSNLPHKLKERKETRQSGSRWMMALLLCIPNSPSRERRRTTAPATAAAKRERERERPAIVRLLLPCSCCCCCCCCIDSQVSTLQRCCCCCSLQSPVFREDKWWRNDLLCHQVFSSSWPPLRVRSGVSSSSSSSYSPDRESRERGESFH